MRLRLLHSVGSLVCAVTGDHDPRIRAQRMPDGTWEGSTICHRCEHPLGTTTVTPSAVVRPPYLRFVQRRSA